MARQVADAADIGGVLGHRDGAAGVQQVERVRGLQHLFISGQRQARAKELPPALLASYDRISKARGGVAIAAVTSAGVCGGCRVSIRPQAVQELRSATGLMVCESCGRYLYWHE